MSRVVRETVEGSGGASLGSSARSTFHPDLYNERAQNRKQSAKFPPHFASGFVTFSNNAATFAQLAGAAVALAFRNIATRL